MPISNKKKQFASLANYNLSLDKDDSKSVPLVHWKYQKDIPNTQSVSL